MNPTDPTSDPTQHVNNPLSVMSPGEKVLCEINRHPFGLFGIYLMVAFMIIIVVTGAVLAPHYVTISDSSKSALYAVALSISVVTLLWLYVAMTIYKGNRWIVTSDSITQISQVGLFRKQTSQLSLANLEDVTFEQNSFVQTMLGFGTLKVETAGERSKFAFPFCPKPNQYAKEIIQAHEQFIQAHPEDGQAVMPGTMGPQAVAQQPIYQQPVAPVQQPQPQAPQAYYAPPTQQPVPPVDPTQQNPQQ